ncbi:baseplate wedge subunit protein [Escherichia phage vB_EcoM_3A1_SA_NWU]|uniref:baseplate J/gp47 family protein n=2 Tax=Bacteria TaxID=2 RepID=UPI001E4231C1|nr:baseplate J/gp47 family protein [Escherichia coli]UKM17345.1 baseplate J-like protein [Escherichia phage SKA64]WIL78216.1 baseplate wedge subunit protein [Escherichia phage vB_EcoM_3A1_SA_NWU]WIL78703.1 hypothetical protein NWUPM10C3_157 [Escherichia phage vB_EcoM_10C3_SA_NWU]WIL79459.1 hypothetical protein NWUPM118_157 [Escherichia phage vB_EcoM_118_SA_NWU]MCC5408694.1 baseplate J/gp47 family protein [Escherichia coli]
MDEYGLTDAGFVIPTFDDVLNNYMTAVKNTFGADAATSEDTVIGQLFRIIAYTDYTLWEGMQGVYNTQTLDGAEGIYLDEIFSKRGFYRAGAAASTGYAYVKSNNKAAWTYELGTDIYFNSDSDMNYYVSTPTMLNAKIAAYQISRANATATGVPNITFYAQSAVDGGLNSKTLAPGSSTFITDLETFIKANLTEADRSLVFSDSGNLSVGFTSLTSDTPVGLVTPIKFYASVPVGTKWSEIPVVAAEKGYNPVGVESITGISSTFTGYLDSGNFYSFSPGRDVETDAEFRSRFNDNVDEANAGTRAAIVKALLLTDGVTKVKIYDNPTLHDQEHAPAMTFQTIVYGGSAEEVAEVIYKTKPINSLTHGTTNITVTTEDGGQEIIRFSPGASATYSVKLVYQTVNGTTLSGTEKQNIVEALQNLQAYFELGSSVTNDQIKGVIYAALAFGRLTSLRVYVKLNTEDDSKYTENNIVPAYNVVPSFDLDNISYEYGV